MFIHNLIEKAVGNFPHETALIFKKEKLSYQEMNKRADSIAAHLIKTGVRPGDVVGLSMKRSLDLICALLGILKAGAAYLPLDPEYPSDRLKYMAAHARVKLILCDKSSPLDIPVTHILADEIGYAKKIDVDSAHINLCYVIYTSGSTGKPKGVSLGHKALVNLIEWQNEESLIKRSVTLQFTPVSFDVHFQEIFSTLSTGGTLVLIDENDRLNPDSLIDTIVQNKVGRLFLPYVALNQLAEVSTQLQKYPSTLKEIITAGEQLKITPAIRELFLNLSNCTLFNHYGPSETHVVTSHALTGDATHWPGLPPIGREIRNVNVLILDDSLSPVSDDQEGEIYLGGICLADGYIHSTELTQEKFINTKFGRLYKTGDIGIKDSNGVVSYLGRIDGQVKVRGYRVETGEIELHVLNNSEVEECVVILRDGSLLCYLKGAANIPEIREYLKTILPDYMVPAKFMKMDSFPLTPSGKIDKKNLPEPDNERPELQVSFVEAKDDLHKKLVTSWQKFISVKEIGINDSFFDLGGNSLLALKAVLDINQWSEKKLSVVQFFQYPTVASLASFMTGVPLSIRRHKKSSSGSSIAIVGMTGRFPGSNSVEELWANILQNKNLITKFETNNTDPSFVPVEGKMPGDDVFDFRFFGMTPRESELMDPQQRKFLELSHEALELSGHSPSKYEGSIGVFAGMGNSYYGSLVQNEPDKVLSVGEFNVMLGLEKDYIATRTAYKLNLKGPALSLHTGCSTSLVAIVEAVKSLRAGDCDLAVAGGISISGVSEKGHYTQEGGILTRDGACRPFDENATGTVFTDGAGILVLKRLEDAEADHDNIIAVIKGVGINNDGSDKMSFTAPSINGQVDVIRRAHSDANIKAEEVGYIEAHGTATPVGDPIEVEALSQAFNTSNKNFCYLGSLKSNAGHLTAAAGAAGVIKAAMSLKTKIVPGIANFKSPNRLLNIDQSPFILSSEFAEFPLIGEKRLAGVSSFGVGGTNAHVVLEEYRQCETVDSRDNHLLFKLSAKNEKQLAVMEENLKRSLLSRHDWAEISFTLEAGRSDYPHRSFLITHAGELQKFSAKKEFKKVLPLIFAFPGQGSQYPAMGREFYEASPVFKNFFDEACDLYEKYTGIEIKKIIFDRASTLLNDTFYTQPSVFIIEYSLAKTFIEYGVCPEGLIGHSIGEYVAGVISGIFSLDTGIQIIAKRAELVSKLPKGKMLSLACTKAQAQLVIQNYDLDIAAVNSPVSTVVAGDEETIRKFKAELDNQGVASVELKTSHAFHSRMMVSAVNDLCQFVSQFKLSKPTLPFYSTTKSKIELDELTKPKYWANHLVHAVEFFTTVEEIISKRDVVFLEVGPKNVLTNLIKKAIATTKCRTSDAIQSLGEQEISSILRSLGELWQRGHSPDLTPILFTSSQRRKVVAPTYAFEQSSCWITKKTQQTLIAQGTVMNSKKDLLIQRLQDIFESASGVDVKACGQDMTFLEMGMDSLFLTQITLKLKKEFNTGITFRQLLEEFSTLNLLADSLIHLVPDIKEAPAAQKVAEVKAVPVQQPTQMLAQIEGLEGIIQRQLELMNSQLQLLRGGAPVTTVAAVSAPVVQKTSVSLEKTERSKEAFGAAARITKVKSSGLSAEQTVRLNQFFADYSAKTKSSKKFTQDNRKNHADPRVVTGFKPENKEIVYPIVVNRSNGQKLWDIDGNEYVDMICGFGSNFFGNGNEKIKSYVQKQIKDGIEVGPQHELTGEVSKLICDLTGNERAAFCNTGSEAVLGAMRIARTVTGREKIIVFSGSYHGINDEVIIRAARGLSYPASPGINDNSVSNMIVLDYGTEESLEIIRKISHEVAAVLIEPVQSRRCDFHPKEFLKEVRKITEASDTCLIFDEVITGFRILPGGAQEYFGIRADLCTYGKIVGGGMPIGVISGKSKYMDALDGGHWQYGDDSTPEAGVTYFAGTFVRHPLALAAAKGALEILKEGGAQILNQVTNRADRFAAIFNGLCVANKVPLEMNNFGSLMKPKWKKDVPGGEILFALMRFNGVHCYDGFPWFVNLAHTDAELEFVINVFEKSIKTMQFFGIFEEILSSAVFDSKNPPVAGAKLGRDESGNPAWYIENPSKAGEYMMVEG